MYRLGIRLPRSRFCLPLVDGEARVCQELVPLRRVFLSDGDEAKTALSLRNKSSPPLLRHSGALLKRRWWGLGVLGVSPGSGMQLRPIQVILQLAFFFALIRVCSWMLWFVAGRIWLRSPLTTVAVDGERRSGSGRSWCATPVDG